MTVSRRGLLKLGTLAAVASIPTGMAIARKRPSLVIFDSRLPQSIAFARAHGGRAIDIAHENTQFWRAIRTASPKGRVVGMTRWSDLVLVRATLEEKGKRMQHQAQADPHQPFIWEMA